MLYIKVMKFLMIVLLLFTGCKQSFKETRIINDSIVMKITRYTSNDGIKAKKQFLHDSIPHGYHEKFYKNGQLKKKSYYQNGKKIDTTKVFYKNGALKIEHIYFKDSSLGISKWYYKNGNLKERAFFRNGEKHGPTFLFYKDGTAQSYGCYNSIAFDSTKLLYAVYYDEDGEIAKEGGHGFPIVDYSADSLNIKDTFKIEYRPINPPHAKEIIVYVGEKDGRGEYIGEGDFINKRKASIKNDKVVYKKSWNKPGKYWVGARLLIQTNKKNARQEFNTGMKVKVHKASSPNDQ
jgi:hypothetical protein